MQQAQGLRCIHLDCGYYNLVNALAAQLTGLYFWEVTDTTVITPDEGILA